jgi:hypothetical protein
MRKTVFILSALVLAVSVSGEAGARGRAHFGVFVGGPYWGPYWGPAYYYPPPYYYYPPAPAQPQEYVERIDQSEQGWWYYCEQSRGYYPYVKECATGWKRVPPTPAPSSSTPPQ